VISDSLQKLSNSRAGISVLIALWVIIQIVAFVHFGVRHGVDSERYIQVAQSITVGNWPKGTDIFYTSYCLLIAGFQLLGLAPSWIVLLQLVLSAVSIIGIYATVKSISTNNLVPWMACLLYVMWFKFQQWNLIVYTDSLFTSMVILSVWVVITADSRLKYAIALAMIVFTTFIRPTGIGFLLAISFFLLYDKLIQIRSKYFTRLAILFLFLVLGGIIINVVLKDFIHSFLLSYSNAEIIYPKISLGILPPDDLIIPGDHYEPLLQLLLFAIYNPIYMIKISVMKGVLFFGHVKPYYSVFHNLLVALYLFPIYGFAISGVKQISEKRIVLFMITFVGFNFLMVSITSENWDGRFLLAILPWVFILAAFGITQWLQKKRTLAGPNDINK